MKEEQLKNDLPRQNSEVIFTSPSNGASFTVGFAYRFVARTLAPSDIPIDILTADGLRLVNGTGSVDDWLYLTEGTYRAFARAYLPVGEGGYVDSPENTFTVHNVPGVVPYIGITEPAPVSTHFPGQIKFSALVNIPPDSSVTRFQFNLFRNGAPLVEKVLLSAPYSFDLSLEPGSYRAVASMTVNDTGMMSPDVNFSVINKVTWVALTSPSNGAEYTAPGPVPLSVRLFGGDARSLVNVTYYQGSQVLAVVTSPGFLENYQYNWNVPTPGKYDDIRAVALLINDAGELETDSVSITVVSAVPTGIKLISPADEAVFLPSDTIPLKAELIGGGVTAVDYVMFSIGDRSERVNTPGADGTYGYNWTGLTEGRHKVSAIARLVDGGDLPEASIFINIAGEIELITPQEGEVFLPTDTVTLSARLVGGVTEIVDNVKFSVGGKLTGEATAGNDGTYSLDWAGLTAGTQVVFAEATLKNGGKKIRSASVFINVAGEIQLITPGQGEVFLPADMVSLSARLVGGVPEIVDNVKFSVGGKLTGEAIAGGDGTYSIDWTGLTAGRQEVFAVATLAGGEKEIRSASVSINVAGEIRILSPENDEIFQSSDTVPLRAELVGGVPEIVASVRFAVGSEETEEVFMPEDDGTYVADWEEVASGRHEIVAVATLTGGGKEITSESVYIQVSGGIELVTPVHGQQFKLSEPVLLKARLAESVPVNEVEKIRFIYEGTLIEEMPGNGTDTYEHSWVPDEARRYESVRVIADLTGGGRHRSPMGVHIRVNP